MQTIRKWFFVDFILSFTILTFIVLMFCAMCVLEYIFHSLAIYRIMKKRQLSKPFLAWIPFTYPYALGSVYDDITREERKDYRFRMILLISNMLILQVVCIFAIFRKYIPHKKIYLVLALIFTIVPIIPFVPGLCLLKAAEK